MSYQLVEDLQKKVFPHIAVSQSCRVLEDNTHRFVSGQDMQETLMRYTTLYKHQFPQSALKSKTPMQAMKDWYKTHPHLFHKRHYDHSECDT